MNSIWTQFQQNSQKYFIRFTQKQCSNGDNEIACWLTDLKVLYGEQLTGMGQVIERIKAENPRLMTTELEDEIILTMLSKLPSKSSNAKSKQITFTPEDNRLHLTYFPANGVQLKFTWSLSKCDEATFFEMVTKPLCQTLHRSNELVSDLMKIIESKDTEIGQYKLDGAKLLRTHFETQPFDANASKWQTKTLFDCEWNDVVEPDANVSVASDKTTESNVSNESRESEKGNNPVASIPSATTNRPNRSRKIRNRGYDVFKPPTKVQYASATDSDSEEKDDVRSGQANKSITKSDSSGTKATTATDVVHTNDESSAKTAVKKLRNNYRF